MCVYLKYLIAYVVDLNDRLTALRELAGQHGAEPVRCVHQDDLVGVEDVTLDHELDVGQLRVVHVSRVCNGEALGEKHDIIVM